MLAEDEDALICDLAQYYNIYDYTKLPPSKVAVFAWGLPEESRIKKIISGMPVDNTTILLASAVDRLSVLVWQNTEDGVKGKNAPPSILDNYLKKEEKPKSEITAFDSFSDYEAARAKLIKEMQKNG